MCLAVPGKITSRMERENGLSTATVDLQGSRLEVSLALVPQARVGDWILIHAGYAISRLEESEARETWDYLHEAGILDKPAPE